ncbi:uncharacterized protein LOC133197926 [Saccostrea echinata]|uniref:uncharacterized protein LOC133197926 n=1 Tax=Saccostrea echinata TaxID=191078 RepID=UPI002A8299C1|nr:uncharacterized protein LOC133197926 [Saccostrea echinata]
MENFHCIAILLLLVLSVTESKPVKQDSPKGSRPRSLLDLLEEYLNQRKFVSPDQPQPNKFEEKGRICAEDENNAERQTIHIDGLDKKPGDLCINKKQEHDDELDIPPPKLDIKELSDRQIRNFGISSTTLWENNVVPFIIDEKSFGSGLNKAVSLIQRTAYNISQTTCVTWRMKTPTDKYFIKFIGNIGGCWSYPGNRRIEGTGQILALDDRCLDEYTVLHEMYHALGGIHEQQRDRRKYFVKINWENIYTPYTDQFALFLHTNNTESYDYRSILQYHLHTGSANFKPTMSIIDEDLGYLITNSKYTLSFYDIAEINQAYNCPKADCTLFCQNHGFRIQPVDQRTCSCHCPSGLKGTTCEELDTDEDCGKTVTLRNGESQEIKMSSYTSGKMCTWLIKAESNSLIKAIITFIDLPYSARKECYHWLEIRDYLIGDPGKELCGNSTTPKTYTQMNIGESSPFMIRFNSRRNRTPGKGFTIRVHAFQSGCMSSPCKTGSSCSDNGDGSYTCSCHNGVSGTNCDEFGALSHNFCDFEDDFGTCVFDQDTSGTSDILWSFNTRLCGKKDQCLQGTGFQYLTMSPSLDKVPFNLGSKAIITTTVRFTAYDRCLYFDYAALNPEDGQFPTQLNVYVEGKDIPSTNVKNIKINTTQEWQTTSVSIKSVQDLKISIEGIFGDTFLAMDNIFLRPGLCSGTAIKTACSSNPCRNGGRCVNSPFRSKPYRCLCQPGYPGLNCEGRTCRFEVDDDPACFLNTRDSTSFWFRRKGQTPSKGTGPSAAFEGQFYFYFEATNRTEGDRYGFTDKGILFKNNTYCLLFYLNMNGRDMGRFSVYTTKYNIISEQIVSIGRDLGNGWYIISVNIQLEPETHIVIEATRGSSDLSDIAIDDVTLMPHPCVSY